MLLFEGPIQVWYHSYYLGDPYLDDHLMTSIADCDGLLGVALNAANIMTGLYGGHINLQIHVVDELPPLPTDRVSSQSSLELTEGRAHIWAAETGSDWTHEFGRPVVLGVQVVAEHRDDASDRGPFDDPVERHVIYLSETADIERAQGPATDQCLRVNMAYQRRQREERRRTT